MNHKNFLRYFLFLCCLLGGLVANAQQSKEEIQRKQQELQRELQELNRSLQEIKSSKKSSLAQLALVQKKIKAREELVRQINKDMRRLDDDIYLTQLEMNRLRKELDTLKQQYAKSLVFAYKNRSNYDYLNFLFSAKSFNDAVKRIAYLKSYRQFRETQAATINQTQNLLAQKAGTLTSNKLEKNSALQEENKQLTVLQEDRNDQDRVVKELKGREKEIASELANRERQRQKLRQALATIIRREEEEARRREKERLARVAAEERARKEAAAAERERQRQQAIAAEKARRDAAIAAGKPAPAPTPIPRQPDPEPAPPVASNRPAPNRSYSPFESTPEGLESSLSFEQNRGRLPWPVGQGVVTGNFGIEGVPESQIKRQNDGILIGSPVGSQVRCIADGTVSMVADFGQYTAVMVRHGRYATVYSQVEGVTVSKGQAVKSGTVIGKVAANLDGEGELDFQVINGSGRYENPVNWLKRR